MEQSAPILEIVNPPHLMTALVYNQYGQAKDVLHVQEKAYLKPQLRAANDVLIQVHAASINPVDWKLMHGFMSIIQFNNFPFVPGFDMSGVIVEVGSGVRDFKKGDEVFAMTTHTRCGAFAEYALCDAALVALKPDNISHVEAASVPLAALTSYQALVMTSNLKEGQKVLVIGGSGGTGMMGIQIAKYYKCTVATVCSGRNAAFVTELGADTVIDYTQQDWGEVLAGQNYDVIYDAVGGLENYEKSFKVLKPNGYYTTIAGDKQSKFTAGRLLAIGGQIIKRKAHSWVSSAPYYDLMTTSPSGKDLATIGEIIKAGALKTHVGQVYSLTQADAIHMFEASESQRVRGKLVLAVLPNQGEGEGEGEKREGEVEGEGEKREEEGEVDK